MPWWGWILVAISVTVIGYLKLKVWGTMTKKKSPKANQKEED